MSDTSATTTSAAVLGTAVAAAATVAAISTLPTQFTTSEPSSDILPPLQTSTTGYPASMPPFRPATISHLTHFLQSFFPIRTKDVPFHYHSPWSPSHPSVPLSRIVLSITPTPGVYASLQRSSRAAPALAFLHRPFTLDRHKLPRSSSVLSSHVGFDEVLTVGWNEVLAQRLGVRSEGVMCLQGYKGDPDRRIGIVGLLEGASETGVLVREVLKKIEGEFGRWDEVHGVELEGGGAEEQRVRVVAIMNAFHHEEVERVLEAAFSRGWIESLDDGKEVLYLTGQAREFGLAAAMEKRIKVVCVGHRRAEEWGIRYLASRVREEFPMLQVDEVYEDEEPRPPRPPKVPKVQA